MAEFCLRCWNKINGTDYPENKYIISKELCLCEECQEMTNVIVTERKCYYLHKFRFVILPFKIIYKIIWVCLRLLMLPYFIYKYYKHNKNKND